MANLMMFGALLLVAVMTEVRAQSASLTASPAMSSAVMNPPSASDIAPTSATSMPVPVTSTPGTGCHAVGWYGRNSGTCTNKDKCCNKEGYTNITVGNCEYWNQSCSNDDTNKVCCAAACPAVGSYGEKSGNCTNKEECCEKKGNTTITVGNCNYPDQSCNNDNTYKVCCGAAPTGGTSSGILNASFIVVVVGIFFYLVKN